MSYKKFDLNTTDKRMPYTTSDDFFDKLEDNIWEEVKDDYLTKNANDKNLQVTSSAATVHHKAAKLRLAIRSTIAVAASVALVFIINMKTSKQSTVSINDVDQAFSQLSPDDQTYLLNVYQDDVFINE